MNVGQAYDSWANQYDSNHNRTRDLEGQALRTTLETLPFTRCLEIGCGTGKNTEWLLTKAQHVTAVDLSAAMLAKAQAKIVSERVQFRQADITAAWDFGRDAYDLVGFSLMLEHIEHLGPIFLQAAEALVSGGHVYVGELHPFKQYSGSKARFDTAEGTQVVDCFTHHLSEFVQSAQKAGLVLVDVNEWFDDGAHAELPRILTLLFRKP